MKYDFPMQIFFVFTTAGILSKKMNEYIIVIKFIKKGCPSGTPYMQITTFILECSTAAHTD
jgi:hypothetical protein